MEQSLLNKVDLVVASSQELQRRKANGIRDTVFLSHGVDAEHFAKFHATDHPVPDLLQGVKRPIIGFFGVLAEWVDLNVLVQIAQSRQEWSVVLIGPVQTNVDVLRTYQNIHLIGSVDYNGLPAYAKQFDVAIIPFVVNDLTINVNPLKLLEYFACGLPVVSTPLPEVVRYGDTVSIAETPAAFISAIESALTMKTPAEAEKRVAVAINNSWNAKAEEFSRHLQVLLESRR